MLLLGFIGEEDTTDEATRHQMGWRQDIRASVGAAVAVATLAGCGHPVTTLDATPHSSVASLATASATRTGAPAELLADGKLTVCTAPGYAPFEFRHRPDGPVVGFDVDLAAAVAADLETSVATVEVPFRDIVTGRVFDTRRCDLAASAVTITTERAQAVTFTGPYFQSTQGLLVRGGSTLSSDDDLHGVTVGVEADTTSEEYAADNLVADVTSFENLAAAGAALQAGTVDAVIGDTPAIIAYAAKNPAVAVNAQFATGEQYGLVVAGDNQGLLKAANDTLARVLLDGTLDELEEKWFGS